MIPLQTNSLRGNAPLMPYTMPGGLGPASLEPPARASGRVRLEREGNSVTKPSLPNSLLTPSYPLSCCA
jgi:hypothetical protein